MKVTTDIQIDDSHEANIRRLQEDCLVNLNKLAGTCCLPIRSERMQALKTRFDTLDIGLANSDFSGRLDTNIAAVEECGEAIGGLFVTCCTPKREKLYLELVKNLNNIHTNLWKLKGISH